MNGRSPTSPAPPQLQTGRCEHAQPGDQRHVIQPIHFQNRRPRIGAAPVRSRRTSTPINPIKWIVAQVSGSANVSMNGTVQTVADVTLANSNDSAASSDLFVLDTSDFPSTDAAPGSSFQLDLLQDGGGSDLVLSYNAAPEPGAALMTLAGFIPALLSRRRRK